MILRELEKQLDRVAARLRMERLLWAGAAIALLIAIAGAAAWSHLNSHGSDAASVSRVIVLGLAVAVPALLLGRLALKRPNRRELARRIERAFPDLRACLLTAADQCPNSEGQLGILQRQVVYDALAHARRSDWRQAVGIRRMTVAVLAQFVVVAIIPGIVLLARHSGQNSSIAAAIPAQAGYEAIDYELSVTPGDTSIERGTNLSILARFAKKSPAAAELVLTEDQDVAQTIDLTKSLDDPLFGGRVADVARGFRYRIEYDGRSSPEYRVTVFDYPALERADATVTFPEWSGLPVSKLNDVRRVSLPEGATLELSFALNKPVTSIKLQHAGAAESGSPPLQGGAGGVSAGTFDAPQLTRSQQESSGLTYSITLQPTRTQFLRLELTDDAGRMNREPIELAVEVVPNRRPDLKVTFPARDVRVSPLEEVALEGTAWDDFGLVEYGVVYNVAGGAANTLPLGKDQPGRETQSLSQLVAFETLGVQPDDLVAWHFYADDRAPDGAVRRTYGDMFFAEVRHFDEIFRQGQAPPGGGGPQGGGSQNEKKAEELAEQQKQIATATWNVMRRPADDKIAADVRLIGESQQKLLEQAGEFSTKLKDAKSRVHMKTALDQMTLAVAQLAQPSEHSTVETLPAALIAEQAAYQSLLKLRAREHNVVESSGGGGGGGGGGKSQQQLDQLELTNQKNRYQTGQQEKKSAADPAKREQLQVLNRLRELARRQADVNEKLRDLDRALRDAKTEQEQAEIQRQLKRLREELQQALRDVDELRDRMDRPENQQEMSESKQQLEQTRERVRQSSESLKEGQVSKALSSGVRAERELDKMREDFRKKTANRFADDMQRLRSQARELAENEDAIREKLQRAKEPSSRKSLRTKNENEPVEKALSDQTKRVSELLDGMKQVVEQAEPTEPLLSKQLYDAARKARENQPSEQLDKAAKHVRQNRTAEAAAAEELARKGIDSLRQGIDRAAESVLGDETESLRRARDELSDLTRSVDRESADKGGSSPGKKPLQTADAGSPNTRADSKEPANSSSAQNQSSNSSPKSNKPGRSGEGQSQSASSEGEKPQSSDSKTGMGESPDEQPGEQPGSQKGSEGSTAGSPSTEGAVSSGEGGKKPSSGSGKSGRSGKSSGESKSAQQQSPSRGQPSSGSQGGSSGGAGEGPGSPMQPLTGGDFQEWSDRLRDVEEILSDPQLKSDAARIRDRARSLRAEFKRHSQEPNWDLVRTTIVEPLTELQLRVAEDLSRRESRDSLAPIDRDPVPERYSDLVKQYYERLGK